MSNQLLLDRLSRQLLADFLTDRSAPRPETVPEGEWTRIITAQAVTVDMLHFGAIMDSLSPGEASRLLDTLRITPGGVEFALRFPGNVVLRPGISNMEPHEADAHAQYAKSQKTYESRGRE